MKIDIPVIANCLINGSAQEPLLVADLAAYVLKNKNMVFPHKHSFYHFVVFTAGTGSHTIDFKRYEIKPQQVYFMAPGQVHTWEFQGDEAGFIVNFNSDYFQSFLWNTDYLMRFSFLSGALSDCLLDLDAQTFKAISALLTDLITLQQQGADADILRSMLLCVLLYIEQTQGHKKPLTQRNSYNATIYHNFRKLVDQQFKSKRLPKEYAELLYITPNHLNAICKDYIGQPAGEIIRARVVLEAQRLLINRQLSIAEIASILKFADNSYFTKFFKKQTGHTPEEFRKLTS